MRNSTESRSLLTKYLRNTLISPYDWRYTLQLPFYFLQPSKRNFTGMMKMPLQYQRPNTSSSTEQTIKLMFAGDLMQLAYDKVPLLSSQLCQLIESSDYFILNCEAPITDKPLNKKVKRFVNFSMPLHYVEKILQQITLPNEQIIFGVANNHSRDEADEIFNCGTNLLKEKLGIHVVGNDNVSSQPYITLPAKQGLTLGVSAWTHLMNGEAFLEKRNVVYRSSDITNIDWHHEKQQQNIDFLLGMPHWDREYQHFPQAQTQQHANSFMNNGFDLLLGSHPHVLQPSEFIDDKLCCYSLGNFSSTDRHYETKLIPILEVAISCENKNISAYHMHFFVQIEQDKQIQLISINDVEPSQQQKLWRLIHLLYESDKKSN